MVAARPAAVLYQNVANRLQRGDIILLPLGSAARDLRDLDLNEDVIPSPYRMFCGPFEWFAISRFALPV